LDEAIPATGGFLLKVDTSVQKVSFFQDNKVIPVERKLLMKGGSKVGNAMKSGGSKVGNAMKSGGSKVGNAMKSGVRSEMR
jgi:hypothetical protein